MATAAAEDRRRLALDVRSLVWTKRIDAERFVRTGNLVEWTNDQELPDTPAMRQAKLDLEREMQSQIPNPKSEI